MRNFFLNGEGRVRGIWMMLVYAVISVTFFRVLLPLVVYKLVAFDESKSIYQQPLLQCLFMWPALGFTIFLGHAFAKSQGHSWEYMGLRINKVWFRRLAVGFALGSAVGVATMAAYWALGLAKFEWNPNAVYGSVVWGVYWCLMVGLFEESDYRGYFFRKGMDSIGLWPAIVLQAALFAAAHAANPGHS
ncbi:MAG: CPBP family intramembrane metalloprotease, partial [Acidobacteria bacterium]|nr:CPBP family intramembrane metalloprotease [Acidobacteriota bacterium]